MQSDLLIAFNDTDHARIYYPKSAAELLAIPEGDASLHMSDCMALIVDPDNIETGHEIIAERSKVFVRLGRERLLNAALYIICLLVIAA